MFETDSVVIMGFSKAAMLNHVYVVVKSLVETVCIARTDDITM